MGGVERVDRSRARARRGSARRIRRGPLAPGITGRPAGVRSANAGSNVRRGARSTAKIERSRARVDFHGAFTGFRPGSCATARQYLARSLSPKARARLGRCGDSRRGSCGRTVRRLANARLLINLQGCCGCVGRSGRPTANCDRLHWFRSQFNSNHEPRVRANILKTSIFPVRQSCRLNQTTSLARRGSSCRARSPPSSDRIDSSIGRVRVIDALASEPCACALAAGTSRADRAVSSGSSSEASWV